MILSHPLIFLLNLIYASLCSGVVHEINQENITEFLDGKLFALTFVDSPSCSRCRNQFPFFLAASQSFLHDPEIFFTRTQDMELLQKWDITELPALVYHREGLSQCETMHVDVTVDDVVEAIARTLHGNFGGLTRTYCVHLTEENYEEMVVSPRQSVLLLLHDEGDESEVATFEKVANAFRKDDVILLATLNVSKQRTLRDERFVSRDTPTIIWLPVEDKTKPKRFGGVHSPELLTTFINERTGLNRNADGALQKEAGLIPKAESLLREHMEKILKADLLSLKQVKESLLEFKETEAEHHHENLDYYMYIVDKVASTGGSDVIKEMISALDRTLFGHEGRMVLEHQLYKKSTRIEEKLKRRKNILSSFRQAERDYLDEAKAKQKQAAAAADESAWSDDEQHSLPQSEVTINPGARKAHVHTEL